MEDLLNLDLGIMDDETFKVFRGDEENEFAQIPDGIYTVSIEKVEAKMAKESQKPYLNMWTNIVDGDFKGQKIFIPFFFTSQKSSVISGKKIKEIGYVLGLDLDNEHFKTLAILQNIMDTHFKDGIITVKQTEKNNFKTFTIIK